MMEVQLLSTIQHLSSTSVVSCLQLATCLSDWSQAKVAEVCNDFELPSPCCIIALNHTASYFSLKGRCVSAGKINVCQYDVSGGRQSWWPVLYAVLIPSWKIKLLFETPARGGSVLHARTWSYLVTQSQRRKWDVIRCKSLEHHLFGSFGFRQQGSQTLSYFFLSPPVPAAWSLLIRA